MSNNHVHMFFKRTKFKPRKLDVNSPELSNTQCYKNLPIISQGKKYYCLYLILIKIKILCLIGTINPFLPS